MKDSNVIKTWIWVLRIPRMVHCVLFCSSALQRTKRERWEEKKVEYTVGLSKGNSELTNLACCYILLLASSVIIWNAMSSHVPKTQSYWTCWSHLELMQESNQEFLTWEAADGRVALLTVGEGSKHDVFFLTVVSFPNAGKAWDSPDSNRFNGLFGHQSLYIYIWYIYIFGILTIVFWTCSYNMP